MAQLNVHRKPTLTVAAPFRATGRAHPFQVHSAGGLTIRGNHAAEKPPTLCPFHCYPYRTHPRGKCRHPLCQPRHTPPCPPTKRQTIFRWYFMPGFLVECRSGRSSSSHPSHPTNGIPPTGTRKPQAKLRAGCWHMQGSMP